MRFAIESSNPKYDKKDVVAFHVAVFNNRLTID